MIQSDVGGCRLELPAGYFKIVATAASPNLALRLCGIVFVGQPALRLRFNIQRIGLRAEGRRNQVVMGFLCLCQPRLKLGGRVGEAARRGRSRRPPSSARLVPELSFQTVLKLPLREQK